MPRFQDLDSTVQKKIRDNTRLIEIKKLSWWNAHTTRALYVHAKCEECVNAITTLYSNKQLTPETLNFVLTDGAGKTPTQDNPAVQVQSSASPQRAQHCVDGLVSCKLLKFEEDPHHPKE